MAKPRPDGHSGTADHDRPRQTTGTPLVARLHADQPDGLRAKAPVAPVLAAPRDHRPANWTSSAVHHGQPWPRQPTVQRYSFARSPSRLSRQANAIAIIPITQNRPAGSFNPASMRSARHPCGSIGLAPADLTEPSRFPDCAFSDSNLLKRRIEWTRAGSSSQIGNG